MPYGTSGFNVTQAAGRATTGGGGSDPLMSRYFKPNENSEGHWLPREGSRINQDGTITVNGVRYAQVDDTPDSYYDRAAGVPGGIIDDPEFGRLARADLIDPANDDFNNTMRVLIPLLLGGAAFTGGALGGEAFGFGGEAAAGVPGGVPGAGGEFATLPNLPPSTVGTMGPGFPGLGEGAAGISRAVDPSLLEGISGGGLASGTTPALTAAPPITGASGLGGVSSFLGNNAGNLVRGGTALASLIAGNKPGGSATSGGGGGMGDPNSIIEAMAGANRVNQNTPFGSRAWSQGADGRWTVNDSLNPAEQANFENVQGLNAGVTDMARQRLAALMAGTGRQRADRPLTFNGKTLGG